MTAADLIVVAQHLEGLLDFLEEDSRHTLKALREALQKLQDFVDRVQDD